MYKLIQTSQFRKDLKNVLKRSKNDFDKTFTLLGILQESGVKGIPGVMQPHRLKGKYRNNWECHIKPDLLIIWIQIESPKHIKLVRVGSHSDLFQ